MPSISYKPPRGTGEGEIKEFTHRGHESHANKGARFLNSDFNPAWYWGYRIDWLGGLFENLALFRPLYFQRLQEVMKESTCVFPMPSRGAKSNWELDKGRPMDKGERCKVATSVDGTRSRLRWGASQWGLRNQGRILFFWL